MVNKMTREEKILKLVELSQDDRSCIAENIEVSSVLRIADGDLKHLFEPLLRLQKVTLRRNPIATKLTFSGLPLDYIVAKPTKIVFGVEVELIEDSDFDEEWYISAYVVSLNPMAGPMSELRYSSKKASMHKNYIGVNITFFKNEKDAIKVAEAMNKLAGL